MHIAVYVMAGCPFITLSVKSRCSTETCVWIKTDFGIGYHRLLLHRISPCLRGVTCGLL